LFASAAGAVANDATPIIPMQTTALMNLFWMRLEKTLDLIAIESCVLT